MSIKHEIDNRVTILQTAMGKTLWEVQGVEQMMAKYYAIVFKLNESPTLEEIGKEFDENFTHTAGRLLGLLRKADANNNVAINKLENFVSERNWLVHKLRREDYLSLSNKEGFEKVIQRVQTLEAYSAELIFMFHNRLIEYFINLGTPQELIEQEQEKALRKIYGS